MRWSIFAVVLGIVLIGAGFAAWSVEPLRPFAVLAPLGAVMLCVGAVLLVLTKGEFKK